MPQKKKSGATETRRDPDETVTFDATPRPFRGGPILCLASGGALVLHHLLVGVLATPFFGGEAFTWGNVLGSFVLSLALGLTLGELLAWLVGGSPWRLVSVAGFLVTLSAWALPWIARHILDRGPDSPFAPGLAFLALLVVPGFFLASVVPAVAQAPSVGIMPVTHARAYLRRFALAMLGGLGGLVLASWGMRHADEAFVWIQVYALGGALVVLGLVGLGNVLRVASLVLAAATVALVFQVPSEIQSAEFGSALSEAFVLRGCGRYYAGTAPEHVLNETDIKRRLDDARRRLRGNDRDIAILLVVETLKTLGPIHVSGEGLRGLLDIYLPSNSKPLVLPFVDKIAAVRSDGHHLHFVIKRSGPENVARFEIQPTKDGEKPQEFVILNDFDLTVSTSGDDRVTKLEVGPQTVEKAGLFEVNDTIKTPFLCKNVALWIDACLLAVEIENDPDRVTVKARAQASVGKVQTVTLQSIDKSVAK